MAAMNGGRLFGSVCSAYVRSIGCTPQQGVWCQVRGYAARKGYREKARKAKVKVEIKKVGYVPVIKRNKNKVSEAALSQKQNDSWKPVSPDNVWLYRYYRRKVHSFADAVQWYREVYHPTILDNPNAPVIAHIELNMQGAKKTRFVEKFIRTVDMPHPFPQEVTKTILAICKGEELQQLATEAGATLVGGPEIVKEVMVGKVSLNDFNVIIAHPVVLPELVALRGLLKKRFPNMKDGTLDPNIDVAVKKYANGVEYQALRDDLVPTFGWIQVPIGPLDMDVKHLEENYAALLNDVNRRKPKREGPFITKTMLLCAPSTERVKIEYEQYITPSTTAKEGDDDGDDDEDEPQAAASSN